MTTGPGVNDIAAFRLARFRGWAICLAIVFSLRLGACFASRLLEYAPYASLWFPAAAVTFERGAVDVAFGRTLLEGLAYACIHCLAYGALACAVVCAAAAPDRASLPATISVFLLAGLAASTVAAIGGSAALYVGGTTAGR